MDTGDKSVSDEEYALKDLRIMEAAVNYRRWIYSLIQPHLGDRIFEVGSGTGNLTEWLAQKGSYVFGIEPNPLCFARLSKKFKDNPQLEFLSCGIEDCPIELAKTRHLKSAVCVNVLEHIRDDVGALRLMHSATQEDGNVVLLLPAGEWAYGAVDKALGHHRRYSRQSARAALTEAGFFVGLLRYVNLVGLIGWAFNARTSTRREQNPSQVAFFDKLVPVLSRIERWFPPPIGLSLLAVGKKQP